MGTTKQRKQRKSLSKHEKLLLVLLDFTTPQPTPSIVVAAWRKFPADFGLLGFRRQYPDARLISELRMLRSEWVRGKSGRIVLTREGRKVAIALRGGQSLPKPATLTVDEFLSAAETDRHLWAEYAELIRANDGIIGANAWGFTVTLADGERTIDFGEGLTPTHYEYFAPHLSSYDQSLMIRAVLENLLYRTGMYDLTEVSDCVSQHCRNIGWDNLPASVAEPGFENIVKSVQKMIAAKRKSRPPEDVRPTISHSSDFSTVVWFGNEIPPFNEKQRHCVRLLWAEWEKGLGLSEKTIGKQIGSRNSRYRLIHTFRKRDGAYHHAWGTMIRPRPGGKGIYDLWPKSPNDHR